MGPRAAPDGAFEPGQRTGEGVGGRSRSQPLALATPGRESTMRAPVCEMPMPSVKVRENEPFDVALRRFKRSCEKAGILAEVRKREYYEKPTAVRKRKAAAAVKRNLKKLQREARRFEKTH